MSLQSVNPRCNFCSSALMGFHCLTMRERGAVGKVLGHICRGVLSSSHARMNNDRRTQLASGDGTKSVSANTAETLNPFIDF